MSGGGSMLPSNQTPTQNSGLPAANDTVAQASPTLFGPDSGFIPLAGPNAIRQVCPAVSGVGEMRCYALERADLRATAETPDAGHRGYGPSDLQSAYNVSPSGGKGAVVAIVDAYGYPKAESDLAAYRKYYNLPACTTANGCLRILDQNGGHNLPAPNSQGWDYEQALDLDMVSAMCPNCKIILFQAQKANSTQLYTANHTAAGLGAVAVSNSYGGSEFQAQNTANFPAGHTYVASAGDNGGGTLPAGYGGPQQPCTLANIVCVGGTHLTRASNSRGWSEVTWNDLKVSCGSQNCGATNSACSTKVAKPSWQHDNGCTRRSASDVSTDASPLTPVAVYHGGWLAFGGTSASSPMIAGMVALAGNGKTTNVAQRIWGNHGTNTWDVTSGSNIYLPVSGPCASTVTYICQAGPGYDGPTGWGTPHGLGAL